MMPWRLLNRLATTITLAIIAGVVPDEGGGKVCLHFDEAVRNFRVDCHLFGLEIRVGGKISGKESATSRSMSKNKDDEGKKVEVYTEHVKAWRRYQEELASGTPNPDLWPL